MDCQAKATTATQPQNPPNWEGRGAPGLMRDFLPGKVAEDDHSSIPPSWKSGV